jgi:hypothetical protein
LQRASTGRKIPQNHRQSGECRVISQAELDDRTVLEPGNYQGRSTHLGFIRNDEYTWTPTRHFLELDTEQIDCMGGKAPEHLTVVEYDVTKYVENGSMRAM